MKSEKQRWEQPSKFDRWIFAFDVVDALGKVLVREPDKSLGKELFFRRPMITATTVPDRQVDEVKQWVTYIVHTNENIVQRYLCTHWLPEEWIHACSAETKKMYNLKWKL